MYYTYVLKSLKDNKLYIVGDEALEFANMFNKETRRPISRGVISPTEKEAKGFGSKIIKVKVHIGDIVCIPVYEFDKKFRVKKCEVI